MTTSSFFSLRALSPQRLSALALALLAALAFEAAAQQTGSKGGKLPPNVVTNDPALTNPQADADADTDGPDVSIKPDDDSQTRVRSYGKGGRPARVTVDPPHLPNYSQYPATDAQSVIPDADPVRGGTVQPPMWTLWSW